MTEQEQQLEREYEAMLATMRSPGWKLICEDFERIRAVAADVRKCANLDFNKGQLDVLDLLMGWRDAVEKAHQQLLSEAAQPEAD